MTPNANENVLIPGMQSQPGTDRLLAIDVVSDDTAVLYQRTKQGQVASIRRPFTPWLVTTDASSKYARLVSAEFTLSGDGPLRVFKEFSALSLWSDALRELRRAGAPHLAFTTRPEQFLVRTGLTLFRGMRFEELRRAQIDIETLGLDPADPRNEIIIITASINGREPFIVHAGDYPEYELIEQLTDWIRAQDPDVIEGHNLFNFDLPFLAQRAHRYGLSLTWGRDGSSVRFGNRQRFKAGARTIPFESAYVHGRHIIDTYQQIQRYDVAGRLSSYGLKQAIAALGLERPDRAHVEGDDIAAMWRRDPDFLIRYAIDDVLDTNLLSELTLPTEFYQAQLLPSTLQSVATGGPGEKVNDLLVRAYLAEGIAIPLPDTPREYPGGYTAVRATGVFGPVVNADVESLYPSIMLADGIAPASDRLGVFIPILRTLTARRLQAKRTASRTSGAEGAMWSGMQNSLKVLINSFYGYLGYGRGYFSDFNAAERVTLRGHEIIQRIEQLLTERGAMVIEIDTDGVYFVPPGGDIDNDRLEALVRDISAQLGPGISLSVDGVWAQMMSLRLKNYALLGSDGTLIVKGSSLRSRRDEPFLHEFLQTTIRAFMQPQAGPAPRDIYLDVAGRIIAGELAPEEFARQEMITERTFSSEANRRLARAVSGERIGERVSVYQRANGDLERIENYAGDEDRAYLLQRLRSAAERFRPLYDDDAAFDYDFPMLTPATDLQAVRERVPVSQPKLF